MIATSRRAKQVDCCRRCNHRWGAHTEGRPSAFESWEHPGNGTRQSSDPKSRGKYLIQWRPKTRDRVWIPCPTDKQLVEPGYKWKSFREPTASESTDPNFVKQEDEATHENPDEAQNKRSKRSKRAQRQFAQRDKYRVWAGTIEEAGLGSGMVLGSQCKQVTSPLRCRLIHVDHEVVCFAHWFWVGSSHSFQVG